MRGVVVVIIIIIIIIIGSRILLFSSPFSSQQFHARSRRVDVHESFDNSRQAIRVDFECDLIARDGCAHVAFPFEYLFFFFVRVVLVIISSSGRNSHVRVRVDASDKVVPWAHDERHLRRVEVERDEMTTTPRRRQLFERREEAVEPGETELGERPAELHSSFRRYYRSTPVVFFFFFFKALFDTTTQYYYKCGIHHSGCISRPDTKKV